jgi:methyl-accepting chemotaxis protein
MNLNPENNPLDEIETLPEGFKKQETASEIEILRKQIQRLEQQLAWGGQKKEEPVQETAVPVTLPKTISATMEWYRAVLNSIPYPVSITDNSMNWIFLNKAAEVFFGDELDISSKKLSCKFAGLEICKSENCGIELQKKGISTSAFYCKSKDKHYKVDTVVLKNDKGENTGFIEIFQDITKAEKLTEFNLLEMARVAKNIYGISVGNFDYDTDITPENPYIIQDRTNLLKIYDMFYQAKENIKGIIEDIVVLSEANSLGKLSQRADSSKYKGDYLKIVNGINGILDTVVAPIQQSIEVIKELSKGNLSVQVIGDFKGEHADLKNSINESIRFLQEYITEISAILQNISKGNLATKVVKDFKGNFIQIKDSLNLILASFNELIGSIKEAGSQMDINSRQVAEAANSLSQGASEQAGSLEQITSALQEIEEQTKSNARNATEASKLAQDVKEQSITSQKEMDKMLESMDSISDASENISKIIKEIDGIAFQTNILALNAAVEAARAGQYGRGFNVVAEEVRNLASRSAIAAKETANLIESTIKKISIGRKIANSTAEVLNKMTVGVQTASDLVSDIAGASKEQAMGITETSSGIAQISQVTMNVAAAAEESAASSRQLANQSESFKNLIEVFTIDEEMYEDSINKTNLRKPKITLE